MSFRFIRLAAPLIAGVLAADAGGLELAVEAPPELAAAAARVRVLEGIDISSALALIGAADPGGPIRVVLAGERSELSRRAPSWVAGYALPQLSTVVLFPARVPSYPDRSLEALVTHEVTHVLVARAAAGARLPRWFDEGVATVAAREWGIEDRARTALALLGHRPVSFAEVDDAFAGEAAGVARAYALSAAFVRFALRRWGRATVARTLAAAAGGAEFAAAFRGATGVSLAQAQAAFFRHEALWGAWVPFLTSSTALWIGITALALLAIARRRRRDAEIRAAWAEEEAMAAPSPVDTHEGESDRLKIN